MATHHDTACLNHLANILVDARRLYARAARIADDADVIARIDRTLAERDKLLTEIRSLIISRSGQESDTGTFLGAAHKAFLNVRSLFDSDGRAALGEVLRGERYLCEEMRKAIRNDQLSAEVRAFLGLALDRIVTGEMRIVGKLEQVERSERHESVHPMPPHS